MIRTAQLLTFLFATLAALSATAEQLLLPSESIQEFDSEKFFQRPAPPADSTPIPRVRGDIQPVGALTGATIFVSSGHGWFEQNGKWITQRGNSYGVLEDHSNAETVNQYLIPLLWSAGANIVSLRERDMQTNEVIVTRPTIQGRVLEISQNEGPYPLQTILETTTATKQEAQALAEGRIATATYSATLPEAGDYAVYVWYSPTTLGPSAMDATFTISPAQGLTGERYWQQNLNQEANTWKYIGTHYFEAGKASVAVSNQGSKAGEFIAVNAVRFGGGMGSIPGEGDSGTSGKPRWEESGLYYATFAGFNPGPVLPNRRWNQVHAMPRFAEWIAESLPLGRSVYLSWHTNASLDNSMSGISTYIYGTDAWDSVENFSGTPGSERLAYYVHNEVLNGVRQQYDASWEDVGIITRWLGETNPLSNGKTPSMLLENGFHDNPHDAAYIVDPQFRKVAAWSAYKGLVNYFHNEVEGFEVSTILPETPQEVAFLPSDEGPNLIWKTPPANKGDGVLGDKPTSYRVYLSTNGFGFDAGHETTELNMHVKDKLPANTRIAYARVAAVNEGGESLPSEVLAITMNPTADQPKVLLINAYTRLDSGLNRMEESGAQRGILSQMNTRNSPVYLAKPLADLGLAFASKSANYSGYADVENYSHIICLFGNQKPDAEESITLTRLMYYAEAVGSVIISGSNLTDYPELALKLHQPLQHLRDARDTESTVQFDSVNLVELITNSNQLRNRYPALNHDVYDSVEEPLLVYKNADGEKPLPAAAFLKGKGVIAVGFPMECISSENDLKQVLEHLLNAFPK